MSLRRSVSSSTIGDASAVVDEVELISMLFGVILWSFGVLKADFIF